MVPNIVKVPTKAEKEAVVASFIKDLKSYTIHDERTGVLLPVICCICDSMPTEPHWYQWVDVNALSDMLDKCKMMARVEVADLYPPELLNQYTVEHSLLKKFVLSPKTYIDANERVLICKGCLKELEITVKKKKIYRYPPKQAIANGYIIGDAPFELNQLNAVELSLVSRVRLYCQSWVFFGGCHQHIMGWHTFFKNRTISNVSTMSLLSESGMKGSIMVVLCGPFTETQQAMTMKATKVDPGLIIAAFQWLKRYNFRYVDMEIPEIGKIPIPVIIEENVKTVEATHVNIENQINITCVFPDSSLPDPSNGGFGTQNDFRKFVAENQDGHWNSQVHSRPLAERMADYKDDTIADSFPRLYPYGFTGLPGDKNMVNLEERMSKIQMGRNRLEVFRKFMKHRIPAFHGAMFNLVMFNVMMKEKIFLNAKMYCNIACGDGSTMSAKFGTITADELEQAIDDVRNSFSVQYSNSGEHRFLRSIRATCGSLPHTNEAAEEARMVYFSFLMKFGLPCIFLTISPDDLRSFRIRVYSLMGRESAGGIYNDADFTDADVVEDFRIRTECRLEYPGLCAEEYNRLVQLVIRHVFNWNVATQKSCGIGLFAEIEGWCLATEEQGRKSLHGHFLLFVKDWKILMDIIQRKKANYNADQWTLGNAISNGKRLYKNACSARIFTDFESDKVLDEVPVFWHVPCSKKQRKKKLQSPIT